MRKYICGCLSFVTTFILAAHCCADDGAVVAIGGTVSPLTEHPAIRLISEFVHIDLRPDNAQVECVFFLENTGPATTVTVGFPNLSGGADVGAIVPFSSFVSYVDGETTSITMLPDTEYNNYDMGFGCWYTKQVVFDAGQRRCIRDVYTGTSGGDASGGSSFEYILWSGATWVGPIGVAEIVVTADTLSVPLSKISAAPRGWRASGGELRWHFVDFEPSRGADDDRIRLYWNARDMR